MDTLTSRVGFGLSESAITMTHISGEYWIAELSDEANGEVVDAFRVGFRIGVEGLVQGVCVDFEENMRKVGRWIWFERVRA